MKKFMFGMIIGFVLSLGTSTFANTDVLAKIFDVKLKVNGIEKQLNSKSYNIDGSTYVPLREIGNLTGYDVTYKADLQTIELNNDTTTQLIETNVIETQEITLPNEGKDFTIPEIEKFKPITSTGISGRELINILGEKYNTTEIYLTPNNVLEINGQKYILDDYETDSSEIKFYNIGKLIQLGIIDSGDINRD